MLSFHSIQYFITLLKGKCTVPQFSILIKSTVITTEILIARVGCATKRRGGGSRVIINSGTQSPIVKAFTMASTSGDKGKDSITYQLFYCCSFVLLNHFICSSIYCVSFVFLLKIDCIEDKQDVSVANGLYTQVSFFFFFSFLFLLFLLL